MQFLISPFFTMATENLIHISNGVGVYLSKDISFGFGIASQII